MRRWWIAAIAIAAVLAVIVMVHPGPLPGEVGYVRWWQRFGEPVPTFAEIVRFTTSTEAALVIWLIPMVWVLRRGGGSGAIAVGIALVTMLVAQPVLKEIVDRPRPSTEVVEVRAEYESKSFPSGHSMSTTTAWGAAAATAWSTGRKRLAIAALVPVVVTFFASAVQGVHWPTDAIAGTLIGAVAAALVVMYLRRAAISRPVRSPGRPP